MLKASLLCAVALTSCLAFSSTGPSTCELESINIQSLSSDDSFGDFSLLRKHVHLLEYLGLSMISGDPQIVLFSDNPVRVSRLLAFYFKNIFDVKRLAQERPLQMAMLANLSITPTELSELAYAQPDWLSPEKHLRETLDGILQITTSRLFENIFQVDLSPGVDAPLPQKVIDKQIPSLFEILSFADRNFRIFNANYSDSLFETLGTRQNQTLFINVMQGLENMPGAPADILNFNVLLSQCMGGLLNQMSAQKSRAFSDGTLREKIPFVVHILPLSAQAFYTMNTMSTPPAEKAKEALLLIDTPIDQWLSTIKTSLGAFDEVLFAANYFSRGYGLVHYEAERLQRLIQSHYAKPLLRDRVPQYLAKSAKVADAESLSRFALSLTEYDFLSRSLKP